MIQIGRYNTLPVLKHVDFGVYLDGGDGKEILLPSREVPENCEVGTSLEVFICYDSEDRLIATTVKPLAQVGEFAHLMVKSIDSVGAFLDWGLPKDLFLPFREQSRRFEVGQKVVVFVYIDTTQRIAASMRLQRNIDKTPGDYKVGDAVELFMVAKTDLGLKAVINGKHWGVLYENEVFQALDYGQRLTGYIHRVRPDGKIDLTLQKLGHKAGDDIAPQILKMLEEKGGFLAVNDKTSADTIYDLFGVSKKKYKIALGGLYKQRRITVDEDGIRLIPKT